MKGGAWVSQGRQYDTSEYPGGIDRHYSPNRFEALAKNPQQASSDGRERANN
jgi:hypothetical protein